MKNLFSKLNPFSKKDSHISDVIAETFYIITIIIYVLVGIIIVATLVGQFMRNGLRRGFLNIILLFKNGIASVNEIEKYIANEAKYEKKIKDD